MAGMGLLPGLPVQLGNEVSGTITAMGSAVAGVNPSLHIGAGVFASFVPPVPAGTAGLLPGLASSTVVVPCSNVHLAPSGLPLTESAGLGVVQFTAYYALIKRAALQKDDVVLIHSAMGGLGQAAVRIAQQVGACLRLQSIQHAACSWSLVLQGKQHMTGKA